MFPWSPMIVILLCLIYLSSARQFCGPDLANVMSLVCKGRGYNVAFRTEITSERRYKRGIVDECCKRGCTWSTLETYCSPEPSDLPIRKRSDSSNEWHLETTETDVKKPDKFKYDTNEMKNSQAMENNQKWRFNILVDNAKPGYPNRYFSLWEGLNRRTQGPRGPSVVNKVKRNDIEDGNGSKAKKNANSIEDYINWQNFRLEGVKSRNEKSEEKKQENSTASIPIRHHHRKSDFNRKGAKESGINSSQIGTVPPYFQGRTLVLPPSRKI